ncbi:competence protein ComEC [Terrihabitans soli]|uniref:Competence protein ComEC n=1 Tax=Terrihabitans soli TaxID=708113 RepID=A0A6S6QU54_9HYPH|nr:ComEC/Rec2 family competence protein [Terrihabitans soli]BCJ90782.1 competence protein ComEC [Terrihabitans soli]
MSEPGLKPRKGARAAAAARPGRAIAGLDVSEAMSGLWSRFTAALETEREEGRFFLFLPVAAIGGVLLFFAAGRDPEPLAALAAFAVLAGLALAARARPTVFPAVMLAAAFAAGFLSAALRTERVAAPILEQPVRGSVTGMVESVEPRPRGTRIVIRVETLADLPPVKRPERVRVTVPRLEGAEAGHRVSVEALWRPPPGPVRPRGHDFARDAFFLGIGAVGSEGRPPVLLAANAEPGFVERVSARMDVLRNKVTARILSVVDGDEGAIAAALVTGQRGEISSKANDALRAAGLYHIISISGLHMALFGGFLFGAVRFGLVLMPGFGLRHPVKKYAALIAVLGASFYLAMSGAEVAAQRSFVMIAIVFLAVMFDRQGITMRNLALAAFAAILLIPEAVLGPSFQMSFCAAMAIVAWFEWARRRAPDEAQEARRGGFARFLKIYFGGIVATTIAATLATSPFAAFHFQRIALHSLPGNLIALPIVGILVMPFALFGLILMPFGLDMAAWHVMGFGIGLMLGIAEWIASWPAASLALPAFPALAALCLAAGLVLISLLTTRLRWLGLAPFAAGIVLAASPAQPDIYIDATGRAAAVRGTDGKLGLAGTRYSGFAASTWLAADGDLRPARDKTAAQYVRCDAFGCTAPLPDGRIFALSWSYAALREDCTRAAIVVTRLIAPPTCRETAHVIDAADLAKTGAVALTLSKDGSFAVEAARGASERVWHGHVQTPRGPAFAGPLVETDSVFGDEIEDEDDESAEDSAL